MPSNYSYKHKPFATSSSKKRGRKKASKIKLNSPTKKRLIERNKGSWFQQETHHLENVDVPTSSTSTAASLSASHKKLLLWGKDNSSSSEEDEYDDSEISNEEETSSNLYWVIDMQNLLTYLQEVAECKACRSSLSVVENSDSRSGLGTKFIFRCSNNECSSHENNKGFYTTPKVERMFEININIQ